MNLFKEREKNSKKSAKEKRKTTLAEALSAVLVLLVIFFFGSLADLSAPPLMAIALGYAVFIGSDFTGKQGLIQAIEVYCQNCRCTLSVTPILK